MSDPAEVPTASPLLETVGLACERDWRMLFERLDPMLEGVLNPANFALHCAPAINLFARRADRIHLNDRSYEYHIVPDRTRPQIGRASCRERVSSPV